MADIDKLRSLLKIPINSIIDFENFVEIIYNNANLGTIPSIRTPGNRIFDTPPEVLDKLRWDFVYRSEKELIDPAVAKLFDSDREIIQIMVLNFRRLIIRDNQGVFMGTCACEYIQDEWIIKYG